MCVPLDKEGSTVDRPGASLLQLENAVLGLEKENWKWESRKMCSCLMRWSQDRKQDWNKNQNIFVGGNVFWPQVIEEKISFLTFNY